MRNPNAQQTKQSAQLPALGFDFARAVNTQRLSRPERNAEDEANGKTVIRVVLDLEVEPSDSMPTGFGVMARAAEFFAFGLGSNDFVHFGETLGVHLRPLHPGELTVGYQPEVAWVMSEGDTE